MKLHSVNHFLKFNFCHEMSNYIVHDIIEFELGEKKPSESVRTPLNHRNGSQTEIFHRET